jgi:hypothetical protein
MKILQDSIGDSHESAMFYNGVIATGEKNGKEYSLETFQDGEVVYNDDLYIGEGTTRLADLIDDNDIEEEDNIDIHVDKFFAIMYKGEVVDEDYLVFDNYSDALESFEEFIDE